MGDGLTPFVCKTVYITTDTTNIFGSGNGNSSNSAYMISNENGWNFMCDALQNNNTFNRFSGKYIKLGKNISVSRMAGSDGHEFMGTFDGDDSILTFNSTASDNYAAPFANLSGTESAHAAIKNLDVKTTISGQNYRHIARLVAVHSGYVDISDCTVNVKLSSMIGDDNPSDLYPAGLVSQSNGTLTVSGCTVTGEIATNGKYAAGFVGIVQGSATIENCKSSVTIKSSTAIIDSNGEPNKDGTHGGFIGVQQNKNPITIKGCVFNGKLLTTNGTIKCGGFIGWRNSMATIYDSIFAPAQLSNGEAFVGTEGSATFARNKIDTYNCYYTYLLNDGTNYAPYLDDGTVTPKKYNNGQQAHTVTAGQGVTIGYGTVTNTYNVSGIKAYSTGLSYGGKFYAGKDDSIALTLSSNTPTGYTFNGYTVNAGTLSGSTLTMPDSDVVISADTTQNVYNITTNSISHGNMSVKVNGTAQTTAHYNDSITLTAIADTGYEVKNVTVNGSAVTLSAAGEYSFKMPAKNVTINKNIDTESYFNSTTGTLYLKGTLLKGSDVTGGVVLPENVSKTDVKHIAVDPAGTTFPQDSSYLFHKYTNVETIDLTGADTSSVTSMHHMFYDCESLQTITFGSGFTTSIVTDIHSMFESCKALTSLDLSSFDTSSVMDMSLMFNMESQENSLTTIYVGKKWNTENVVDSRWMFSNCVNLTGGKGTAFDIDHTTIEYAKIDGGINAPGYLTGVYTLTLPDDIEIVTDAQNKLGSEYPDGSIVTVKYTGTLPTGHSVIVKANDTVLTAENGVYTVNIGEDVTISTNTEINKFTVTWKNGDTTLETDENVEYGTEPTYNGATPAKASTAKYSYEFSGWSPEPSAVTADVTYTAQFTENVNKYTITWKNYKGTTLKTNSVEYGATPEYNGASPTKPDDDFYTYTFTGWTPRVAKVTGEAEYTAVFSSAPKRMFDYTQGSGVSYDGYVPYRCYHNNFGSQNISQSLYSADMLTELNGCKINSLTFYINDSQSASGAVTVKGMKVYLLETDADEFTSLVDVESNANAVFGLQRRLHLRQRRMRY